MEATTEGNCICCVALSASGWRREQRIALLPATDFFHHQQLHRISVPVVELTGKSQRLYICAILSLQLTSIDRRSHSLLDVQLNLRSTVAISQLDVPIHQSHRLEESRHRLIRNDDIGRKSSVGGPTGLQDLEEGTLTALRQAQHCPRLTSALSCTAPT